MGIFHGSTQLTRYRLDSPLQTANLFGSAIADHAFRPLPDNSSDERSIGWVSHLDWTKAADGQLALFVNGDESLVLLKMREDVKKIDSAVLRERATQKGRERREERGGLLTRSERATIAEDVRLGLLCRTIAKPKVSDVVVINKTKEVWLGSTSNAVRSAFESLFKRTFGQTLKEVRPMYRAYLLLGESGPAFQALNTKFGGTAPSIVSAAATMDLCREFLTWLWYIAESEQLLTLPNGREVLIALTDKMIITATDRCVGSTLQITGQHDLHEGRVALRQGKRVSRLKLDLETEGEVYTVDLDASLTVHSMRSPKTDTEAASVALERVHLVSVAMGIIDSLWAMWLGLRYYPDGRALQDGINAWIWDSDDESEVAA